MKELEKKLLSELLKNSKRSDRELSKALGVSQATVTRTRNKLAKAGLIQEFTIVPDLAKMGFELMAISIVKMTLTDAHVKMGEKWIDKNPNVIFASAAEGMGKNGVMISLHRNYTEYSKFAYENRQYWKGEMGDFDTILVSLKGTVVKPLSFRYLAKLI